MKDLFKEILLGIFIGYILIRLLSIIMLKPATCIDTNNQEVEVKNWKIYNGLIIGITKDNEYITMKSCKDN